MRNYRSLRQTLHYLIMVISMPMLCSAAETYGLLDELGESFCLDENVNAGFSGILIADLNTATVDRSLVLRCLEFKAREDFREALCNKLLDAERCLEAYALLNQLYPEHKCKFVCDQIGPSFPIENSSIPIMMISGNEAVKLHVGVREFGSLCKEYWRKRLGVRSEMERNLDESMPGWREELLRRSNAAAMPKPPVAFEWRTIGACRNRTGHFADK